MPADSAFTAACRRGDVGSITQALETDDPTTRPSQDDLDRALYDATYYGYLDMAKLLFSKGARITGLALAGLSCGQHPGVYREFLNQGWDPNTQLTDDDEPVLRHVSRTHTVSAWHAF